MDCLFGVEYTPMRQRYIKRKTIQKETKQVAGVNVTGSSYEFTGSIPLLLPIIEKLDIAGVVDNICPMERSNSSGISHGEVIEMLIYNRLMAQTPLYRVREWAQFYAIETIFGIKPEKLNDDRIARALDAVAGNVEEIQSALSLGMMDAYKISPESVHYDITSLSFEGEYQESELVKFGYSRDKRPDLKQVNLSLDVTKDGGIPIWFTILAGNTVDVKTVTDNMNRLREKVKMKDYLTIMDRGMVSADNLNFLQKQGIGFVAAAPSGKAVVELMASTTAESYLPVSYTDRTEKDVIKAAPCNIEYHTKQDKKNGILSETVPIKGFIYESSEKLKRDKSAREKGIKKVEEIFEKIIGKLNTRKYSSRDYTRDQINKKLEKLKAADLFIWDVSGADGELSLTYSLDSGALEKSKATDGKYVLLTNRSNWTADDTIAAYKCQHIVEWRFRHLKSNLKVSPLFVHLDDRITGLVLVTVIALMVYSLLEHLSREAKIPHTAFMLMASFGYCSYAHISFSNGETLILAGDLTPFQTYVLENLQFPHPREYL